MIPFEWIGKGRLDVRKKLWQISQCLLAFFFFFLLAFITGTGTSGGWFRAPRCQNGRAECVHPLFEKWDTDSGRRAGDNGLGGRLDPSSSLVYWRGSLDLRSSVRKIGISHGAAGSIQVKWLGLLIIFRDQTREADDWLITNLTERCNVGPSGRSLR